MGFELTPAQQSIVDKRDKNIIVSAAAGSGKTSVLVRRIINLLNEDDSIDITNFLIVTFTKAAAAEMKERIYREYKNPMVHFADISTIDSFCNKVLRENFNQIGIAPDYNISSEDELKMMEGEVLEALIEDKFEAKDEDFLTLCDTLVKREKTGVISEMVKSIYTQSQSYPWPLKWISDMMAIYDANSKEDIMNLDFFELSRKRALNSLLSVIKGYKSLLKECEQKTFKSDYMRLIELVKKPDEEMFSEIPDFKFERLSWTKGDIVLDEKKDFYVEKRRALIKEFEKIGTYFIRDVESCLSEFKRISVYAKPMFSLTLEFIQRLDEKKLENNVFSFSDVEHFALEILRDKSTDLPTPVAEAFRDKYKYIFVDEYQDSNLLQEAILTAICRENNYFMVGDVKQSIYRFRKARPDMFMEKYLDYKRGRDFSVAIDLSENFRSRREVTDCVNAIFTEVMKNDMGGIEYDEDARLNFSAKNYEEDDDYSPRLYLTPKDDELFKEQHLSGDEIEALLVGKVVKDIVGKIKVGTGKERHLARYSDIVILHRSANSVSTVFVNTFKSLGIPLMATGAKGYFESYEIECMLALLSLMNNVYDDVSLLSVLTNIYDVSKDEIVQVRANENEDISFSEAFFKNDDDRAKSLLSLREKACEMRMSKLINFLLKETGFEQKLMAMPNGKLRLINLEKLSDMAISFERKRAGSLYDFIVYAEKLQEYNLDLGQAELLESDSVKLMTIHKSKGLEFPVCIVSGLGKQFKNESGNGGMIITDSYGVGFDVYDRKSNYRYSSGYKSVLKGFLNIDEKAEYLRLLYVALTRAKEKLILTGTLKSDDLTKAFDIKEKTGLSLHERLTAKSFLNYVIYPYKKSGYEYEIVDAKKLTDTVVSEKAAKQITEAGLDILYELSCDENTKSLGETFGYVYPIKAAKQLKNKYSVSEIKRKNMEDEEILAPLIIKDEAAFEKRIPFFLPEYEETKNFAAIRGTAFHRIMECLDFNKFIVECNENEISSQIEEMIAKGLIAKEEAELVNTKSLVTFFESDLGKRMCKASLSNTLFKEKTFVMSMLSKELFPKLEFSNEEEGDKTLIQGIIDAYFTEAQKLVLVDYKTDKVNNVEELKKRYKSQLLMYERALKNAGYDGYESQLYLYSFHLGKEIIL